jgi:hypothetical protein
MSNNLEKNMLVRTSSLSLLAILSILILSICVGGLPTNAFAQSGGTGVSPGFVMLQKHYFQDHPAVLSVDVKHITTSDNSTNSFSGALIAMRLYDNTTQKDVPETTYLVTLTNVNDETKPIFYGGIFTNSGVLNLKILKNEVSNYTEVEAPIAEQLNVYMAGQNGTVPIYSPSVDTQGKYHLHVEIRGVESMYALLQLDEMPKMDFYYDDQGVVANTTLVPEFALNQLLIPIAAAVGLTIIVHRFRDK